MLPLERKLYDARMVRGSVTAAIEKPGSVSPPEQAPSTHSPPAQSISQPPQCITSDVESTHVPSQQVSSSQQGESVAAFSLVLVSPPAAQTSPLAMQSGAASHVPSTQIVPSPQAVSSATAVPMQAPAMQWSFSVQTFPSSHAVPSLAGAVSQAPAAHVATSQTEAAQTLPQVPQLAGSVLASTQTPSHAISPSRQEHSPSWQVIPSPQALPQAPQFWGSSVNTARTTQLPPQQSSSSQQSLSTSHSPPGLHSTHVPCWQVPPLPHAVPSSRFFVTHPFLGSQVFSVQALPSSQRSPHAVQLSAVRRAVSQPLLGSSSQSAKSSWQRSTTQVAEAQAATALSKAQVMPQSPQFSGSAVTSTQRSPQGIDPAGHAHWQVAVSRVYPAGQAAIQTPPQATFFDEHSGALKLDLDEVTVPLASLLLAW